MYTIASAQVDKTSVFVCCVCIIRKHTTNQTLPCSNLSNRKAYEIIRLVAVESAQLLASNRSREEQQRQFLIGTFNIGTLTLLCLLF